MVVLHGLEYLILPTDLPELPEKKVRSQLPRAMRTERHMQRVNCSVVGLNFDFLLLNIIGFAAYSVYNLFVFFDSSVQVRFVSATLNITLVAHFLR